MPIYEFHCPACRVDFSFLARTVDPDRRPACPRCARPRLERRVSSFAVARAGSEPDPTGSISGVAEGRLEQAMAGLAAEAEGIGETEPHAIAAVMRRYYASSGATLGVEMQEALARLEAGDDPETIEGDMGELLEAEAAAATDRSRRRPSAPSVDPRLYELE